MTTTATSTQLNHTEQRVAVHLVQGVHPAYIGRKVYRSPHTILTVMGAMRVKLGCPPGAARHVLVHTLLISDTHQFTPPAKEGREPALTPDQLTLLRTLTQYSRLRDIAQSVGVTQNALRRRINALHAMARTKDLSDLIIWGHTWGLLDTGRDVADAEEVSR
jgi:hypothetical protein